MIKMNCVIGFIKKTKLVSMNQFSPNLFISRIFNKSWYVLKLICVRIKNLLIVEIDVRTF